MQWGLQSERKMRGSSLMEPSSFLTQRMAWRLQDRETKRPGKRQVSRQVTRQRCHRSRHGTLRTRTTNHTTFASTDPIPSPRINAYIYTAAAISGTQTASPFGGVSTRSFSGTATAGSSERRGPAAPREARRDAGSRLLCLRADDKRCSGRAPSSHPQGGRRGQEGSAKLNLPVWGTMRAAPATPPSAGGPPSRPREAAAGRRGGAERCTWRLRSPAARRRPASPPRPAGRCQPRAPRSRSPTAVGFKN